MADPNLSIDPSSFPTAQALPHWLKPRLPSDTITLWGTKPGTKNVHNLWLELTLGESSILSGTNSPVICKEMICVGNFNNNKKKIGLYQFSPQLSDGTMQLLQQQQVASLQKDETKLSLQKTRLIEQSKKSLARSCRSNM
ncbi:hypothetical protein COLO4_35602 [Corchorus olitorius]|uniref:Uncharacterized protein n=1 Tax=Corchorus olitorius TaxID=93759 RepID=A0A1R3GEZ8_9ROSI|nr:hypothetical protein COLO4_35602 [Corchorus olitorius]